MLPDDSTTPHLPRGFPKPTYFQVPDDLVDIFAPFLSGAEVKVILYICRRTSGFHKIADAISYEQFLSGILTTDGDRLDNGAGVSAGTLPKALRHLEEMGLVIVEHRKKQNRGQPINVYRLAWKDDAPAEIRTARRPKKRSSKTDDHQFLAESTSLADVEAHQKLTTQETVQETEKQENIRTPLIRAADAISAKLKRRYRVDEIAHWLDRLGFDEDDADLPRKVNTVLLGVDRKISLQEIQEQLKRIHG